MVKQAQMWDRAEVGGMCRGHFKTLRVKSIKEGDEDTKGNRLLRRSQSEEQPKPEFGGTTSCQAPMLSPLESVFTYVIPLECLKQAIFQIRERKQGRALTCQDHK